MFSTGVPTAMSCALTEVTAWPPKMGNIFSMSTSGVVDLTLKLIGRYVE